MCINLKFKSYSAQTEVSEEAIKLTCIFVPLVLAESLFGVFKEVSYSLA